MEGQLRDCGNVREVRLVIILINKNGHMGRKQPKFVEDQVLE